MGARHSVPHGVQRPVSRRMCRLCSCFTRKINHETEPEEKPDSPQEENIKVEMYHYQRPTPRRPMVQPDNEHLETLVSSDGDDVSYLSIGPDTHAPYSRQANYSPLSSRCSLESELTLYSVSDSSDDLPEPPLGVTVKDKDSVHQNGRFDVSTQPRVACATKIIKRHYQDDPSLPEPSNSHHDLMAQFVESKSFSTKIDIRTHGTQSGSGSIGGSKVFPRSWVGSKPLAPSAAKEELPRFSRYVIYQPTAPVPVPVTSQTKAIDQTTNMEIAKDKTRKVEGLKMVTSRRGQNPALGYRSGWR